jgi:hypothetical protein
MERAPVPPAACIGEECCTIKPLSSFTKLVTSTRLHSQFDDRLDCHSDSFLAHTGTRTQEGSNPDASASTTVKAIVAN